MTQQTERNFIPVTLAFRDLWYSVPDPTHPKATIDLLKGVSGFALPGTITALMGSSGAGKTTLMDVIAGRKTGGEIRGDIMLNGHPATDLAIRRATGYCEQMDIHSDASTFREALTFSAFLRQGADIPDSQKYDSINECLELLDLHPIADQIIRGSSTEQMKRLTIGVELAAQPSVLFLDEPTSGLDARSAKLIMDGVRKVADTGRTIVCTIHQPSAMVFEVFDSLLLLKRGGEMVFFGDLGEKAVNLIKYFESIDGVGKLEKDYNPATWMLDVIGAGVGNENGPKTDFVSLFKSSEQYRQLESNMDREGVARPSPSLPPLEFKRKRAASNWVQATFLTKRWFDLYWRTPSFNLTRIVVSMVLAISLGVSYLDTEYVSYQGVNSWPSGGWWSARPAVIGFQEVTRESLALLKAQSWARFYDCSVDTAPPFQEAYFVALFSALPVTSLETHPFSNTGMGRELVLMQVEPVPGLSLFVGTSHLESLPQFAGPRVAQLKESLNLLRDRVNNAEGDSDEEAVVIQVPPMWGKIEKDAVRVGKMAKDKVAGGKMRRSWRDGRGRSSVESKWNRGMETVDLATAGLPGGWKDLWLSVPGNTEENGYTFDGTRNLLVMNRSFRSRLDRMYFYPAPNEEAAMCTFDEIVIVGQQKIADGLWSSDHFGLLSTFTIRGENEESGSAMGGGKKKTRQTTSDLLAGSKQSPISID
ncbi:pleiotropic drug resistance protein ABC superfamily [Phytophthora cinnamomi]|uniref:pleiotropic drug resistance protein ABC superfamily n=1 Tax=Phytophthora cinnamomi TaxID=4785 RepID=UPI00355A9EF2|nr:pleiotropic drug resistance protein ABC superfamily [Phytophthora cinnamomi]